MAKFKESAWLIVIDDQGKILLSRRSKKVNNPGLFNFAGGSIDKGEKPKTAAIREAEEEIGVIADKNRVSKLGALKTASSKMHFYIFNSNVRPKVSPNEEVDKVVWVPQNKLKTYALHKPTLYCVNRFFNLKKGG